MIKGNCTFNIFIFFYIIIFSIPVRNEMFEINKCKYVLSYPATLRVRFYEMNIACEMGLMPFYELPYAGINFILNHPPRAPPGICTKNLSPPIQAVAGGGFVGQLGEGRAFVCKRCFFEIFITMARPGDRKHFGVYLLL